MKLSRIESSLIAAAADEFEVDKGNVEVDFDEDGDFVVTISGNEEYDEIQCVAVFEDGQWEFEELEG
ncbi:MAG: hypothetical protein AAF959_02150 [Cyanobacteria bacterium P01_D01_bin.56]